MPEQISMLDLNIADAFDCTRCMWMTAYGFCCPRDTLGRQYYYESKNRFERLCSDYGTAFAKVEVSVDALPD